MESATLWSDIRELFVRTQRRTGGWACMEFEQRNAHMTFSGSLPGGRCPRARKPETRARPPAEAIRGGRPFQLKQAHTWYSLDVIAHGRLAELRSFGTGEKKRDWFREGLELLKEKQEEDGHFKHDAADMSPIVSTSFVLRFLANRVK